MEGGLEDLSGASVGIIRQHLHWRLLHLPFPLLSPAASRDLTFQVHMWKVSAREQMNLSQVVFQQRSSKGLSIQTNAGT